MGDGGYDLFRFGSLKGIVRTPCCQKQTRDQIIARTFKGKNKHEKASEKICNIVQKETTDNREEAVEC